MPTYVCQVAPGQLDADQKQALADAICSRHSEATGAPVHLVQVVIDDNPTECASWDASNPLIIFG